MNRDTFFGSSIGKWITYCIDCHQDDQIQGIALSPELSKQLAVCLCGEGKH